MQTINGNIKYFKVIGGLHGVSVVFPRLQDVIDYEEKRIKVNHGYPRFVTHPAIRIIEDKFKRKFNSLKSISCDTYESAIYLVIDYFCKKGINFYIRDNLSMKIINYFISKLSNIINLTDSAEADILIINVNDSVKINESDNNKIKIGLIESIALLENKESLINEYDIVIIKNNIYNIGVILIYNEIFQDLDIYRRHCGFLVNSRKISSNSIVTNNIKIRIKANLTENLLDLEKIKFGYCYLYPSGMAAVFISIISLISSNRPKIIALGSLYTDTLSILEKWTKRYNTITSVIIRKDIYKNLEQEIDEHTAAILFEFPSNPLIRLVDVEKIIVLAHKYNVRVIIDNTIATPYNFNPFNYNADLVIHSTTKFLNGKNNHLGGALLLKDPQLNKRIIELNKVLKIEMNSNDMRVLNKNLRDFEKRMEIINYNTLKIADFLTSHYNVRKVYYPLLPNDSDYELAKKYLRGGSGLISFILKNSSKEVAEIFYDNVGAPILKGPSLGSEKTLLSPYVMMAHYEDPEEKLKEMGFDFYLMRMSIGIEPVNEIIESLNKALESI
ncbi:MAG: PLP-dependent transferase [Promethearchaeia archaeon]